jgi:hypothetical protein
MFSWWVQQLASFLYLTAKWPASLFFFSTLHWHLAHESTGHELVCNQGVINNWITPCAPCLGQVAHQPTLAFQQNRPHHGSLAQGLGRRSLLLLCLQGYRARKGCKILCDLSITTWNLSILKQITDKPHGPQLPRVDSKHCFCSAPACSCSFTMPQPTEASVEYFYTMCIGDWCVSFLIPLDVGSDSNPFANSYHIDHFAYGDWAVPLNVG